jgi:radical SAM superfamily enzyme YgiQ (UPF0313 family)
MECKLNSGPMLTLQQIAAITPKEYEIELIDDRYDSPDFDTDAELIGISTLTASAPRAYKIADEFKNRNKTVVMGGMHPSALPKEALEHADSVVIGEAEGSWLELLNDFKKGKIKPIYKADSFVDMKNIPPPRHDLIKVNPIVSSVVTSRGCPFNCSYCTLTHLFGKSYRPRPIEDIVNEIKRNQRRYFVLHNDSSLAIDPAYTKALFNAMIPLKVKFIAYGNVPVLLKNEEIIELSRKAGCLNWGFGFETFNKESLKNDANKAYNIDNYALLIKKIHKAGMSVFGSFVFGFDHDTADIFDVTTEKVFELGIDTGEFDILTPYPISRLYDSLDEQGRILTKDWEKYDFHHVVFEPKSMTKKELFEGCAKISKKFYSPLKTISRVSKAAFRSKDLIGLFAVGSLNNVEYRFQKEYDAFRSWHYS